MVKEEINFRSVFDNYLDAVIIGSAEGKILTANTAACEMFGMSVEELIAMGREGLITMSREEIEASLAQRGPNGSLSKEFTMRRKGGAVFPVAASSKIYTAPDGKQYTLNVIQDITERIRANSLLREKEANLRSLIENTDGPVWSVDQNLRLIDCNANYLKRAGIFFGIEISRGDNIVDCLPPGMREEWRGYYLRGLSGQSFRIQSSTHPPLELEHLRYYFNPIILESGEIVGVTVGGENITDLVNVTDNLRNTAENMRALTLHMENVIEKERTTIAHELHDDLGQKLTAIKMNLSWLESRSGNISPAISEKFEQTMELLDEALSSTRRISKGLRPVMLDDLGLVPTIKWQIGEFTRTSGINCRYSFNPEEILIDKALALTILRVIQEALTNAARHSDATEVTLTLDAGDEEIRFTVEDNGKGIDINEINSNLSMGILGMKERVQGQNGKITIEGLSRGGTIVQVSFPMI
jgi:PAS domain S-box-containing protein